MAPRNRLALEKSPYLQQHAGNPVDWYPWGEEAFARARAEDKPIFLSIGYSTCHWCHVMERESFESEAIARLMNELYVCVKVDREERPDVDRVYMAFVQATTGGGGWPMSVFLTPELKPFYGGTYFPPSDRYGRPGFPSVLTQLAAAWRERREEVRRSGERVAAQLASLVVESRPPELLDRGVLTKCYQLFARSFDSVHGGFGQAPKFPRPVTHDFLLRYFARTGDAEAATMVLATLGAMSRGGMYDHLGGGFHRYSVDRTWHVPHFEKMLYDQAQLARTCALAWQLRPDEELRRVACETCDYVLRDLTDAATGAFYSAEDADSPIAPGAHEKAEGAFYVFTADEVAAALGGGDEAALFARFYGIEPGGNADDPHGELTGKNVLHRMQTIADAAARAGRTPGEVAALLADGRARLLALRATRPRPHRDDKVLCAWNGLMVSALARVGAATGEARYLDAAERAARFLRDRLLDEATGTLRRRYRDGEVAIEGYLEDYACFIEGLIDLYEARFDPEWLALAARLATKMIAEFHDAERGGFYSTTGRDPSVLFRLKEDYDGAEPSGSSVAAMDLVRLGQLLDRPDWTAIAQGTVRAFSGRLLEAPHALPALLDAFDLLHDGLVQVVIAGPRDDPRTEALARVARARFLPERLLVHVDPDAQAAPVPHLAAMQPVDGAPAAYVCRDWTCQRPTTSPEELATLLPDHRL